MVTSKRMSRSAALVHNLSQHDDDAGADADNDEYNDDTNEDDF